MKSHLVTVLLITGREPYVPRLAPSLTAQGVSVTAVGHGSAAATEQRLRRYDCIVIDLGAGSDAVDLTRTLRDTSAVPILVVAAARSPDERIAALDAGADDCISAPISD